MQLSKSENANNAYETVCDLQSLFASELCGQGIANDPHAFQRVEWLRNQGQYGGGHRLTAIEDSVFNRASINVSQVQYESDPDKKLNSATALSTIIHFANPHAPSIHMHISWTEFKDRSGYWRVMADLNPSIEYEEDKIKFLDTLQSLSGSNFQYGTDQGNKYFYIPPLNRHRGVAHFYLEGFHSGDFAADDEFCLKFGTGVIQTYAAIVKKALKNRTDITSTDRQKQIDYHTLYFYQVLTLDRGTIAGLLVHNENDLGILASLPKYVNASLLKSWQDKMEELPAELLGRILKTLPKGNSSLVEDKIKISICDVIRNFYKKHPEAMNHLAKGDLLPESNSQHQAKV